MQYALQLAVRGLGSVEPNPPVGAVILSQAGQLCGEGWHQKYGGPHAEIHALAMAGENARGATLFCTLEPCSHFGKTPPCADAVIAAGIRRVVIATGDPAPHVNGQGIARLRAAGIDVQVGVCEIAAGRLIAPFVRLHRQGLPWVHAKWAMSLDGKIATRTGESQWISNEFSRAMAHQLRGRCDAIVVGIGTVLADDPQLTARPAGPRVATRVILDSRARTPWDCQLVRTAREIPTLVAVGPMAPEEAVRQLQSAGVEVLKLPAEATSHRPSLVVLLRELGRRKMTHVLLEGGGELLGAALDGALAQEFHVFVAPKIIGGKLAPTPVGGLGPERMADVLQLSHAHWQSLGNDLYLHGDLSTD
ncbi:MAG: bifunctional diaminohydroxyphosphoribosylaminopyrimidine deaminase/5-amino-6-(5-phosphoribosylamino)uracil reductase RibD [Planctomycetota bacterium]|nr:MAG: bifunctional diaminohydroxyphosphoribosylaminopyrimidine deaminase/5-amino-6-(5-phosphoribosylamino)uracil reductase RibD [Planctomycetota bacterium]